MVKDKIDELTSREYNLKVILEYDAYGVVCMLKRVYHKHLGVRVVADNDINALDKALGLLKNLQELEKKAGDIKSPPQNKQELDGGYWREFVFENYEVEFRRCGHEFVVTDINQKLFDDYYLIKEPYDPTKKDDMWKTEEECEESKYLNPGEELWQWDNIGVLTGSAGYAIVKDGKVIKTKCTMIS